MSDWKAVSTKVDIPEWKKSATRVDTITPSQELEVFGKQAKGAVAGVTQGVTGGLAPWIAGGIQNLPQVKLAIELARRSQSPNAELEAKGFKITEAPPPSYVDQVKESQGTLNQAIQDAPYAGYPGMVAGALANPMNRLAPAAQKLVAPAVKQATKTLTQKAIAYATNTGLGAVQGAAANPDNPVAGATTGAEFSAIAQPVVEGMLGLGMNVADRTFQRAAGMTDYVRGAGFEALKRGIWGTKATMKKLLGVGEKGGVADVGLLADIGKDLENEISQLPGQAQPGEVAQTIRGWAQKNFLDSSGNYLSDKAKPLFKKAMEFADDIESTSGPANPTAQATPNMDWKDFFARKIFHGKKWEGAALPADAVANTDRALSQSASVQMGNQIKKAAEIANNQKIPELFDAYGKLKAVQGGLAKTPTPLQMLKQDLLPLELASLPGLLNHGRTAGVGFALLGASRVPVLGSTLAKGLYETSRAGQAVAPRLLPSLPTLYSPWADQPKPKPSWAE